jgi:hypothetical protein
MSETPPGGRKVGTYTVAALLGLFVAAALLALAGRLLPGRLGHLLRRRRAGH